MTERFERLHGTRLEDNRTASQVDRDRVLYSAAFRRLAQVTQVASADQVNNFHNRLTHTLQVAQVARRAAEFLCKDEALKSYICPDVCETAALAHDLGHPPFGHLAERVLNTLATEAGLRDGFEGNAQSFRIITKLAAFDLTCEGLDLTRASLNAVLKYPWPYGGNHKKLEKWGAYDSEKAEFDWARELSPAGSQHRSIESQIMDWADDVTYSVHDVEDFYKAGHIPLHKFPSSATEREAFYVRLFHAWDPDKAPDTQDGLRDTFEGMSEAWTGLTKYTGNLPQRQTLKSMASELIGTFVRNLGVQTIEDALHLDILQVHRNQIYLLKELTRVYVFENPLLKNMQTYQEAVVSGLFQIYLVALKRSEFNIFPTRTSQRLRDLEDTGTEPEAIREIVDLLSGMTELQITQTFHCLSGTFLGSSFIHPLG